MGQDCFRLVVVGVAGEKPLPRFELAQKHAVTLGAGNAFVLWHLSERVNRQRKSQGLGDVVGGGLHLAGGGKSVVDMGEANGTRRAQCGEGGRVSTPGESHDQVAVRPDGTSSDRLGEFR